MINILANVKSKQNPDRYGLIVEKKQKNGNCFYRILWNDTWASGEASFYEEKDFDVCDN